MKQSKRPIDYIIQASLCENTDIGEILIIQDCITKLNELSMKRLKEKMDQSIK